MHKTISYAYREWLEYGTLPDDKEEGALVIRYIHAGWPEAVNIHTEWEQLFLERIEEARQERWSL